MPQARAPGPDPDPDPETETGPEHLSQALAATATQRADEFTPQGLSQTVWAYSKLGLSKHTLLLAAAAAAGPRAPRFDAQSIATMAWAFANLEVEHGP